MNLKEIISYRDVCIHCNRPMVMRIKDYPKLTISVVEDGLKIKSRHKDGVYLHFGFDGKYVRNKREYKIYQQPIIITKRCNWHPLKGYGGDPSPTITFKGTMASTLQEYFGTTLNSVKDTTCQYSFQLFGNKGIYEVNLTSEFVYWHDDIEFWHTDTYFGTNKTQVYHASYEQKLDEMMRLELPAMNLKNIKDEEQFIQKLKLYALFS